MIANDENLEIIFTIADANKDGSLSIEEFTKTFSKYMKKDDCLALFLAVDIDKSHDVTIGELRSELAIVNAGVIMHQLREAMVKSKMNARNLYDMTIDPSHDEGRMHIDEFNTLVKTVKNCGRHELEIIFRTVDRRACGYLTLEDLQFALDSTSSIEMREEVCVYAQDIIVPLITRIKRSMRVSATDLFAKYKDGAAVSFDRFT